MDESSFSSTPLADDRPVLSSTLTLIWLDDTSNKEVPFVCAICLFKEIEYPHEVLISYSLFATMIVCTLAPESNVDMDNADIGSS